MKLNILSLQDGDDIILSNGLVLRQPTVNDVKILGEDIYLWWVFTWVNKPSDIMHGLWKAGVDYEQLTRDDLFSATIKNSEQSFVEIAKIFFKDTNFFVQYDSEYEMYLLHYNTMYDLTVRRLEPHECDEIALVFEKIHRYKHQPIRKFSTQGDKKKILDYEIEEAEFYYKKTDFSLISSTKQSVVVLNSRSWEYVSNLTVYQLLSESYGSIKFEQTKLLKQGIYSGNVDYKKINKDELEWNN